MAIAPTRALFFYGTLRHLPLLEVVLGRGAEQISFAQASLADHAVRAVEGGLYPALVPEVGATARGLHVSGLSDEDIARLDYYEGSFDYDLTPVTLADGQAAEVYVANPGGAALEGPWSLARWQADWGAISVEAAVEVMSYFGVKTRKEVDGMFPMIRARAASVVLARTHPSKEDVLRGEVVVDAHRRAYADYFVLDEYRLRYSQFGGGLSAPVDRAIYVAPDAAIVLPYDPDRDRVLLVEQFRMGPWRRGDVAWQLEPIAGRLDPGESPEDCARREAREEAALEIGSLEQIARCYPSPGTVTEFYHVFAGICDLPDDVVGLQGLEAEHEDIRTRLVDLDDMLARCAAGEVANGVLVTCVYWLALNRNRLRSGQGAATA